MAGSNHIPREKEMGGNPSTNAPSVDNLATLDAVQRYLASRQPNRNESGTFIRRESQRRRLRPQLDRVPQLVLLRVCRELEQEDFGIVGADGGEFARRRDGDAGWTAGGRRERERGDELGAIGGEELGAGRRREGEDVRSGSGRCERARLCASRDYGRAAQHTREPVDAVRGWDPSRLVTVDFVSLG